MNPVTMDRYAMSGSLKQFQRLNELYERSNQSHPDNFFNRFAETERELLIGIGLWEKFLEFWGNEGENVGSLAAGYRLSAYSTNGGIACEGGFQRSIRRPLRI